MHAFELMLAPYAIAHLKVALELHHVGAGDGAMQILLTDTLEHAARQGSFDLDDPVAEEGKRAAELKENERFSVVLGNPPYDREQRSAGDSGRRKGGVIRYGAPGVAPLFDSDTAFRRAATGRAAKAASDPPLLDAVTEPMKGNYIHGLTNVIGVGYTRGMKTEVKDHHGAPGKSHRVGISMLELARMFPDEDAARRESAPTAGQPTHTRPATRRCPTDAAAASGTSR